MTVRVIRVPRLLGRVLLMLAGLVSRDRPARKSAPEGE